MMILTHIDIKVIGKMKKILKRNSKENYVAESYNKTGSNRGVNSNSKVSNGNTNRTIKGKTGEVEDVERRKRVSKGNTKKET